MSAAEVYVAGVRVAAVAITREQAAAVLADGEALPVVVARHGSRDGLEGLGLGGRQHLIVSRPLVMRWIESSEDYALIGPSPRGAYNLIAAKPGGRMGMVAPADTSRAEALARELVS